MEKVFYLVFRENERVCIWINVLCKHLFSILSVSYIGLCMYIYMYISYIHVKIFYNNQLGILVLNILLFGECYSFINCHAH